MFGILQERKGSAFLACFLVLSFALTSENIPTPGFGASQGVGSPGSICQLTLLLGLYFPMVVAMGRRRAKLST